MTPEEIEMNKILMKQYNKKDKLVNKPRRKSNLR